jgi:hypothetical protein
MNVNYEPAYLVIDFCKEVKKQNIQGDIPYEVDFDFNTGSQDRKDFMEWLNSRPKDRFEECYEANVEEFFAQAATEPAFAHAWSFRRP